MSRRKTRPVMDKVTVVFVIQVIVSMDKIASVYEHMKKDSRFRVYLLCVPEEKNHEPFDASLIERNRTYEYFAGHGFSCINAMNGDGSFFELESLRPDYCIYVRPYNELLPPCYRSSITAAYSKICLVMYGEILWTVTYKLLWSYDFEGAVSCAYVQDRQTYLQYKRKFSAGMRRNLQRCVIAGLPALENFLNQKSGFTDKWDFAAGGIRAVWTPRWSTSETVGGSNFFVYKDVMLDYCHSHSEMNLIIRPHPLMFTNFRKTGELTAEEAEAFLRQCSRLGIYLDTSDEYACMFWGSDVLVTDFSSVIMEYFLTGNPIVYCLPSVEIEYTGIMKQMLRHCYCVADKKELVRCLDMLLKGEDPKKHGRKKFAQKMVSRYAKGAAERVAQDILDDCGLKNKER